MNVKSLIESLQYSVEHGYANENDEVIILGSGDKKSGFIKAGFCLPKVRVNIEKDDNGYYGLGITDNILRS